MVAGHKLSKNDDSIEVNQTLQKFMVGKLQYVGHSRPNITLSIGIVARFSTNPRENNSMVVKRIMRYLKGTEEYGLYYKKMRNLNRRPTLMLIGIEIFMTKRALVEEHFS